MQPALLPGIGPFSETGYSRDYLLHALKERNELPRTEIAVAALYAEEVEAEIISTVEQATVEELDLPSSRLFFRGLHILGGRRFPSVCRPLLALLRAPPERVEDLLGDAVTETLSQILAGVFDGDAEALMNLVTDKAPDRWVCEAALSAMSFLTFAGRIDRATFESFLWRIDDERLFADDDDVLWHGWMTAAAVLGMTALTPRIRAAFADGRISSEFCDEEDFERLLRDALERPADPARFADENLGYIEDVIVALERFRGGDPDDDVFAGGQDDELLWPLSQAAGWGGSAAPVRNPYRGVGRNDPCPCGSGKKFKKCCGQSGSADPGSWTPPRH